MGLDSFFGGGGEESQVENRIPGWLEGSSRGLVDYAEDVSRKPYEAYEGQRVAGPTAREREGWNAASTIGSAYTPYLSRAGEMFDGADRRFTDADMDQYMNPYMEGVIAPAAREMGEQFERQRSQRDLTAAQRGAFGGLRNEIGNDRLEESYLQGIGDLYARGRGDAWDRATGLWRADRAQEQDLGGQYMGLAGSAAALRDQEARSMIDAGARERAIDQAGRDFDYAQFAEERDWDMNRIQPWLSAVGSVPHSTTRTGAGTATASGGQQLGQGLGFLTTLASFWPSGGGGGGSGGSSLADAWGSVNTG